MSFTASNLCQQYQAALLLSAKSSPANVSRVTLTDGKYEVKLDIQIFQPEELTVRAVDRSIIVEGKHETKGEKLGLISHQLTRKYILPEGVDPEDIQCSIGSDGILTLSAIRRNVAKKEVIIPILSEESTESKNGQAKK